MAWALEDVDEQELARWAEEQCARGGAHAAGYQGEVFLFERAGRRLIVKAPSGAGPLRWLRARMLRHEYRVYRRLEGFAGAPRCYGLLRGRYLVLEYVAAVPLRQGEHAIADREAFFAALLEYLRELHRRGVAHADLKRKDNLLVVDGRRPCLVDFGAAIVRKNGFAPLNRWLYGLARTFDYNAWVKLKYQGRLGDIPPTERAYYRRTAVERMARALKRSYTRVVKSPLRTLRERRRDRKTPRKRS